MIIINNDIHPKREIYFLGAKIIDVLKKSNGDCLNLFDVFQELNQRERVSMNLFVLALDWLFLLNVIRMKDGKIENVHKYS